MTVNAFLEKDNNNFDLIRLILACMVIAGHAEVINIVHDGWTEFFYTYLQPTSYGDVAVKIFFFLSGLLITNSFLKNPSIISFLVARVFRLLPALIFVSVLVALVFGPFLSTLSSSAYFSESQPWMYVLKNALLKIEFLLPGVFETQASNSANGSLWTLPIEFRFYLICLGILLISGKYKRLVFNFLFLIILLDATLFDQHIIAAFGNKSSVNLLPIAFGLGMFFALNPDKVVVDHRLVLGMFFLFYMLKQAAFFEVFFIVFYCVLAFYLATRKILFKLKPRLDLSYGIYLWGYFVQQSIFHFMGSINIYAHIFLAISISAVLAYFTHIIIEKPFIKIGRNVSAFIKNKIPLPRRGI
jgi:peptidoglycan/LPS O-acetylase OafA/YrhL